MKTVEVAAGIIFSPASDQVLLSLRRVHQHQGGRWEFPGGKIQNDESPQQALIRELQEEIGIHVLACHHRLTFNYDYSDKQVCLHFWDVTGFDGEPRGCEGQHVQWFFLSQLRALPVPAANQVIVEALLA